MPTIFILVFGFCISVGWFIVTITREMGVVSGNSPHELNYPFSIVGIVAFGLACIMAPTKFETHEYEPFEVNVNKYSVTVAWKAEDNVLRIETFTDIATLRLAENSKIVKFNVIEHRSTFGVHLRDSYMLIGVPNDSTN